MLKFSLEFFPYGSNQVFKLQGDSESTSYPAILCIFSVSPKNKGSGNFVLGQVVVGGKESWPLVLVKPTMMILRKR